MINNSSYSLSSTLIDEAKQRHDSGLFVDGQEQGVLSKLLQKDKRFATVMAFDMIFAGIDTVSFVSKIQFQS